MDKFIRIETVSGRRYFININLVCEIVMTDSSIEFCFENDAQLFTDESYQTAKDAWLDYWKVSP